MSSSSLLSRLVISGSLWIALAAPCLGSEGACTPAALPAGSAGWTVLGNGTPGSVTQGHLQDALDAGGAIRFDIGSGPMTLELDGELVVTREVVVDGGGLVTLSGADTTRIVRLTNPSNQLYSVTFQHLTFAHGSTPSSSGAAIYKPSGGPWQAVDLVLVDTTFRDNVAIAVEQDGGGGALYATGLDEIFVHDSSFVGNRGSNGGAIYSLGSRRLVVTESDFEDNRATGDGGNPGNGGNGGAVGVDGAAREVSICGSRFLSNRANAYGGAFFSVMYDTASSTSFRRSTFEGNLNPGSDQFAGAVYLQGGPFSIRQSMFRGNEANSVGALFLGPGATGDITNSTFYDNLARQGLAGAISIDTSSPVTVASTTVASNRAPGPVAFAAGIQLQASNQLTLRDSLLVDNVGGNVWNPWNIRVPASFDGGGNLQTPRYRPNGQEEVRATPTTLWADPQLQPPGHYGGPTETLPLAPGSPARGAAASPPSVDQRGFARLPPFDSGAWEAELLCDGFESGDTSSWSSTVP